MNNQLVSVTKIVKWFAENVGNIVFTQMTIFRFFFAGDMLHRSSA